jgi:subtilisin
MEQAAGAIGLSRSNSPSRCNPNERRLLGVEPFIGGLMLNKPHARYWVLLAVLVACETELPRESTPAPAIAPGLASIRADEAITLFVRGAPGSPSDLRSAAIAAGAVWASTWHGARPMAITIPRSSLERFLHLPWLQVLEVDSLPNDVLTADGHSWGVDTIQAPNVWSAAYGNTGSGIKVAVIDDGINCSNPDLDDRIKGGYDFYWISLNYCNGGAHGTPVAGILAAEADGGGLVGVAPGVDLYVVTACFDGACPHGPLHDALSWVLSHGIQVVSVSIATQCGAASSTTIRDDIAALDAAGIVEVWAAGNGIGDSVHTHCTTRALSGYVDAPNSYHVIGVAAWGNNYYGTGDFSQGSAISVSAPHCVTYDSATTYNSGTFCGTSAATPHVAGVAALLLANGIPAALVKRRIEETASDLGTSGKDDVYGWGLVRAAVAVTHRSVVDSITWCTNAPLTAAQSCSITAHAHDGIAPLQYHFVLAFQDSTLEFGWSGATITHFFPIGDYWVDVTATPRDSVYQRGGFESVQRIYVCRTALRASGAPSPDTIEGCTIGGGGENLLARPGTPLPPIFRQVFGDALPLNQKAP